MTTVYLAGNIEGLSYGQATNWRKSAEEYLADHGIKTLNPMRGKESLDNGKVIGTEYKTITASEIFQRDVEDVLRSDVILAIITKPGLGTGFELGLAYAHGIPVVAVAWGDGVKNHPFLVGGGVSWYFEYIEDALYFIRCRWQDVDYVSTQGTNKGL